jgi:RNA polymerase sigma-70 factor, ECF subfamily
MEVVEVRPPEPPVTAVAEATSTDFVECYLGHYRRLVRALRFGGADPATAEDLAQEAFARAMARWRKVAKGSNPPGYVYVTGFRLLQRSLKQSARWDIGDVPEPSAIRSMYGPSGAADPGSTATTNVAVEAILARMPPKRRTCAVMCLIVGLPVSEAGEALGIADGTVRKHLEEARQDLAEILG